MNSYHEFKRSIHVFPIVIGAFFQIVSIQTASAEIISDLPLYSYDVEYTTTDITVKGHVDPSQNIGKRVNVFFPPRELLNDDIVYEINILEITPMEGFFCSDLEASIPENLELTYSDNNIETYRFKPVPDQTTDPEEKLVYKYLQGTVSKFVATGEIFHFVLEAPHSFKLSWLVKINDMKIEVQCRPTPDGRTYASRSETTIRGSAAMKKFEEMEFSSISNVTIAKDNTQ